MGKFPLFEGQIGPRGTTTLLLASNVGNISEYDMEKSIWEVSGRFSSPKSPHNHTPVSNPNKLSGSQNEGICI